MWLGLPLFDAALTPRAVCSILANPIPFNPWPGAPFECSSDEAITAFSDIVFNAGYASPVRTPRGRDIMAACGQLKSDSVRKRKAERAA